MEEIVNRSAIIVRPRQPFLEWCRQDDAEGLAEDVFKSLNEEPSVYLLPSFDDAQEQEEVLEDYWPGLFEAMLGGWSTDESSWPRKRSFEMFVEWFAFEISSLVTDLNPDELLGYYE